MFMVLLKILINYYYYGFTEPAIHVAFALNVLKRMASTIALWVFKRVASASWDFKRIASALSSASYGY